ncbi:MAG TPA: SIS domain-containing protein [Gammaproteobacteria bacterium]|nr:SIS domain-containing protein [Gammaproteobacteria bacterium]
MGAAKRSPTGTLMYAEAGEAAAAVERQLARNVTVVGALARRLRAERPRFVVTCARGSSDHAATFAKYVIETELGCVTASAALSVSSVYGAAQHVEGALYLVISQSGRSTDLLRCAEAARAAGAHVAALVNAEDSPLAAAADTVIPLHAGPERSVPATKSYIATLAALLHLAACWKGDGVLLKALADMPAALREAYRQDWSPLVSGLMDARSLFVLGRGHMLGVAQEAALKLKETCGLHAEAVSAAEVRHGPMALVGPEFPALLFAQADATLKNALATARDFRARGARVWTAAPGDTHADALPLTAAPHPLCAPLLAVQSFYAAVNALAVAKGRDPDRPAHLNKVTETV